MILISKLLLAAAAVVSVWFLIRGLIDMQRVNTADGDVLEVRGVVRQLKRHGRFDSQAVVTLNVDDIVVHVDCLLPGPWFGRKKHQVTDVVRLLWRRGETQAVAVDTIRDGQRMFIIGFAALTLAAIMYILLY